MRSNVKYLSHSFIIEKQYCSDVFENKAYDFSLLRRDIGYLQTSSF